MVACGPKASVAALTANGQGVVVSSVADAESHTPVEFTLEGFLELGMVRSVSWSTSSLIAVGATGKLASCPLPHVATEKTCEPLVAPALPLHDSAVTTALEMEDGRLRAAIAAGARISLLELKEGSNDETPTWHEVGFVVLPKGTTAQSVSATRNRLLATAEDGTVYIWNLTKGFFPASTKPARIEAPAADGRRTWQGACLLPDSKVLRLASHWQRGQGGVENLKVALLV
jgi:hypothetical protein